MRGMVVSFTKHFVAVEPHKQIYAVAVVKLESGENIIVRVDRKYFRILRTGLIGNVRREWSIFGEYLIFEPDEKPATRKVALITGGARGIGAAIAKEFARHGIDVAIADVLFDDEAKKTLEEINSCGVRGIYIDMDVSNQLATERGIKEVVEKLGGLDILVNNAGITRDQYLQKLTPEMWDQVINVNLKGAYLCTKAAIPYMVDGGGGVIINISSIIGIAGNIAQANYAAAKAGLIGLTYTLAKELAPYGIRVVAVAPGFVKTRMSLMVPSNILADYVRRIPIPRLIEPEEVAKLVYHIVENEALNGVVIPVDLGTLISTPRA